MIKDKIQLKGWGLTNRSGGNTSVTLIWASNAKRFISIPHMIERLHENQASIDNAQAYFDLCTIFTT